MASITKKLINKVENCVDESIAGFLAVHPGLRTLRGQPRIIIRADVQQFKERGRVTTLTGGGSGHEPTFMGFVGEGMMTSAVHGSLFASPAPNTILAALRALGKNHPAGVLVVINNYTGDRLNFGIALERARVEGIKAEIVLNAEDCSVHTKDKTAGRRGLAGCVLLMKIAGHLAEKGETLERMKQIVNEAASQVATMGVCWSPCSLPGGSPLFHLGPDEMELGLGMHGEAGVKRLKMQSAHNTVVQIVDHMTDKENPSHILLHKGDKIALLVNNLGSASDIELNIATGETIAYLEKKLGVSIERAYASRYVTSQEMAGLSITLMLLNDLRLQCLDADTRAVSWMRPLLAASNPSRFTPAPLEVSTSAEKTETSKSSVGPRLSQGEFVALIAAIHEASVALIKNRDLLNQLDSGSGDGDCGSTLESGANAILKRLDSKSEVLSSCQPHKLLMTLAETVEQTMGGCSGALYSLLLTAAANQLAQESEYRSDSWVRALKSGIDTISRYGGAEPGDRTMLDPLNAAWKELHQSAGKNADERQRWKSAVEAAEKEVERTTAMTARAGRASYVSRDQLNHVDPGAKAVHIWMKALLDALTAKA